MWRAVFDAPGPERPLRPSAADRALVLVLVPVAIAEGLLRPGLASRPVQIATAVVIVGALAFRRSHPLAALGFAFGVAIATGVACGVDAAGLYTHLSLLLFPYALLRRGSGREVAIGLAIVAAAYVMSALQGEIRGARDALGGAVVLLFPAVLGATVRFRAEARRRAVEHAQLRERALLARELHDTVAHHVSAIAIQAQGGRAVLATRPEAAAAALAAIEAEAARALAELRTLVTSLRDDAPTDLAPRAGLADLEQLAARAGERPAVEIERVGSLEGVSPSVQAALYRMAQESITNALRHARSPSRVHVRVAAEGDRVRLTVRDDGERPTAPRGAGFGLVGMAERAALLGGTLAAGPGESSGWTVDAVLPRTGDAP